MHARSVFAILGCAVVLSAACQRAPTPPAEPDAAKGEALLRQMSQSAATLQTFSYQADEVHQRVRTNGEKVEERSTRHVIVRRPNALTFTGNGQVGTAWYDGKHVTLVSNQDKVW